MASDVGRIEDVTIVHGSLQPRSKAAQQDRALQMLQIAPFLFMNEDGEIDRDRLMRVLDMPSMSSRPSNPKPKPASKEMDPFSIPTPSGPRVIATSMG